MSTEQAAAGSGGAVVYGKVVETVGVGNRLAGPHQVTLSSATAVAKFIAVRWDDDKVRGIRMELDDGSSAEAGDYADVRYALTEYRFQAGEKLTKAWLRDSGYGYGSVRSIEFVTSNKRIFNAGPGGFDSEAFLDVEECVLVGFHAWVNPDNFLNALAFEVRRDGPPNQR